MSGHGEDPEVAPQKPPEPTQDESGWIDELFDLSRETTNAEGNKNIGDIEKQLEAANAIAKRIIQAQGMTIHPTLMIELHNMYLFIIRNNLDPNKFPELRQLAERI